MAMPGTVRHLPEHIRPHVHFEHPRNSAADIGYNKDALQGKQVSSQAWDDAAMLKFPATKNILWDHTSTGSPAHIGISCYKKPKLCIQEKVLRFAQRHIKSSGQSECGCALVGSLATDEDGQGVTLILDRFDPGEGLSASTAALTSGDMAVPLEIIGNSKKERQSSSDDYVKGLKALKQRCCSKEHVDVGNFLLVKGWCNFYTSGDKNIHHLEFDTITMATEFIATPITAVPIVPTALSKNLSGPRSLSHLQGEPKTGYLTMDHTRKVLLALESDPKVFSLPIVGLWMSGVSFVYSPFTWAACLRFLYNASINERVCVPPEPFLLILYSPVHSRPEFYEVTTKSHSNKMEFDLLSGYEVISVSKSMTQGPRGLVDIDLNSIKNGQKKEAFDGALHSFSSELSSSRLDDSSSSQAQSSDEITPRCKPAPYRSQLPTAMSMVPEVSLLFGEDGQSGIFADSRPKKLAINPGKPNSVNHINDFMPQRPMTTLTNQQRLPVSSQYGNKVQQPVKLSQAGQLPVPQLPSNSQSAPELNQIPEYHSAHPQSQPKIGAYRNSVPTSSVGGQGVPQYIGNAYMAANSNVPNPSAHPYNYNGDFNNPTSQQMFQNTGRIAQQVSVPSKSSQVMMNGYSTPATIQQHSTAPNQQASQLTLVPSHVQYPGHQQIGRNYTTPVNPGDMNGHYRMTSQRAPGTGPSLANVPRPMQMMPQNYVTQPQQMLQHEQRTGMQVAQEYPRLGPMAGQMPQMASGYPQQMVQSIQNGGMYAPPAQYGPCSQPSNVSQPVPAAPIRNQYNPVTSAPVHLNFPQGGDFRYVTSAQNRPGQVDAAVGYNSNRNNSKDVNQDQNHSATQGDSSKSSDDSGLSFTPEKGTGPIKKIPTCNGQQPSDSPKDSAPSLGSVDINWKQVPKEVYQLLLQQDAQLKQLQAQIQTLMHNQSASTQHTTMTDLPSSLNSSEKVFRDSAVNCDVTPHTEMCSVGINTTLFSSQTSSDQNSVPTSPQKVSRPQPGIQQHEISRSSSSASSRSKTPSDPGLSNCSNDTRTPAEIRHRGVLPLNSTERDEPPEVDVSQGDLSCVVQNMALHDHTMDSIQSDMIVDIPSYHSSPSRSVSRDTSSREISSISKSPLSASMCGNHETGHDSDADSEDEEDQTLAEDESGTNTKEYYDKLMDNIHKLLNQQKEERLTMENVAAKEEFNRDTLQQSIMLGQYLNTLQKAEGSRTPMDMTFIPKINYMSMIFDSDSDSSMEINAMAMKYLKDEQLTQLNKLHTRAAALKGTTDSQRLALLKHVLSDDKDSTPNVTTMGMSPNDMTFATRKYMEKHGLLSDGSRVGDESSSSGVEENYQLKLNYSTVTSGSDPPRFTHDQVYSPFGLTNPPLTAIPAHHNILKETGSSPYIPNQKATGKPRNAFVHSLDTDSDSSPFVNSYNTTNASHPRTPVNNQHEHIQKPGRGHHRTVSANNVVRGVPNGHNMLATPQRHIPDSDGKVTTPNQHVRPHQYPVEGREEVYSPINDKEQLARQRVLSPVHRNQSPPSESQQHQQNVDEDDKILDITRLKLLPKLL